MKCEKPLNLKCRLTIVATRKYSWQSIMRFDRTCANNFSILSLSIPLSLNDFLMPYDFSYMIFFFSFLFNLEYIFFLSSLVYFRNQSKSTNDISSNEQGATVFESPSRGDEKTSASSKWPQIYGNIFTSANILFALSRIYMVSYLFCLNGTCMDFF